MKRKRTSLVILIAVVALTWTAQAVKAKIKAAQTPAETEIVATDGPISFSSRQSAN